MPYQNSLLQVCGTTSLTILRPIAAALDRRASKTSLCLRLAPLKLFDPTALPEAAQEC